MLLSKQPQVPGHWLRRPPEATIKRYALHTINQGRNRRGSPCYMCEVNENVTGMYNHALIQLAENREVWQKFVVGPIDTENQTR